jgi:hypothetical protein
MGNPSIGTDFSPGVVDGNNVLGLSKLNLDFRIEAPSKNFYSSNCLCGSIENSNAKNSSGFEFLY